jgi:hypothetical protein
MALALLAFVPLLDDGDVPATWRKFGPATTSPGVTTFSR